MTRKHSAKPEQTVVEKETMADNDTPKPSDPVNLEVQASEEPVKAPEAPAPEKLQTDFREKLNRKTDGENIFIPSNPAAIEKAAEEVAKENGFQFNRGTSIGARLIARSQQRK